jgi:o-succinylbenzoate synthase
LWGWGALESVGYLWNYRCYRRQFRRPLQTHHGEWHSREGIILRLQGPDGAVGFGEIAPLPWFGSESFAQALAYCQQLPSHLELDKCLAVPDALPACQFGFVSAWSELQTPPGKELPVPSLPPAPARLSGLLPAGDAALTAWFSLYQQGYRTLKWKIGIRPPEQELAIFQELNQQLPPEVKLRLDANGGLDLVATRQWLEVCSPTRVEFLEQPLAISEFSAMLELSKQSAVLLALDESVATWSQLLTCQQQGWGGVFVLKPAILGSPLRLQHFCQQQPQLLDLVFSTVFETGIGQQAILQLAAELAPLLQSPERALGFGVGHWFSDESEERERLWQRLLSQAPC